MDRWYLVAGQPWPQALEQAVSSCGAVAVFLGTQGLGPWQQRERDLALDRQGRDPSFPVIPVLLSPADPALGFLKLNTWVDLSAGAADEAALDLLVAAIRRQPPGPLAQQKIAAIRAEVCPYRGLRPFREEDEPFFFGRELFTEALATTLARQTFVAVVGASGSGKSSVVRAGLIPRLRRGGDGCVWDIFTLVPTDRPLASLTAALLPSLEPELSEADRLFKVNKLASHLADGSVALRDITGRILEKQRGTDRLLLIVDQWEELYTLCRDEQICRAFAAQLLGAAATGSVKVVMTMRGDFFGRALADRSLADQLQNSVVTIGPMTRDELAATIVKPAEAVGLSFESGLAETILDDVGDEPGSLPLLEFLLEAMWKARRGSTLQYDAYFRLGRVSGAIAHRADEVFERGFTESEREAAHRLLIRMVRSGEGVEDTRQRAAIPEADPVAEATIRKLADARLVVTERANVTGQETVELAHEALIRSWQRLRGWIDQDREFLRTRERIAAQARLWENEGRPPDRLLPAGRPLAEGEDLLQTRGKDLEDDLVEYIRASSSAEAVRKETVHKSQRRQLARARLAAAAMLLLAAAAGGFASWWATEREAALAHLAMSQRNEWRALAALTNIEAEKGAPSTAVRVALSVLPMDLATPERRYLREAEGALLQAMQQLREVRRFVMHEAAVSSAAFSPDGRTVLTGSRDRTARLWD
ncbi:MAG: nSTAND1 domain-containing NTPase, partial [Rhodospirillales bacterium]